MELGKNMQYIAECVRQKKEMQMLSDEKINLFIGMVVERYNIQNSDEASFRKIITEIYGIQYILAGHEHEERAKELPVPNDTKGKKITLHVATKSLLDVEAMNEAIIKCGNQDI